MVQTVSLYKELQDIGVSFFAWELGEDQAIVIEANNKYGMFLDVSNIHNEAEEKVIIAHEGGHICTGATHAITSPLITIEKHEKRADKWAIKKLVPQDEYNAAIAAGHIEIWDLAEHFGVTEDFMKKAVCYYTYGNLETKYYF